MCRGSLAPSRAEWALAARIFIRGLLHIMFACEFDNIIKIVIFFGHRVDIRFFSTYNPIEVTTSAVHAGLQHGS